MLRQFFLRCVDTVMMVLLVVREEIGGERAPATIPEAHADPVPDEEGKPNPELEGTRQAMPHTVTVEQASATLADMLAAHFGRKPTAEELTEGGARARFALRALFVQRHIADLLDVHPAVLDLRWDADRDDETAAPRVCDVKIRGARITPAAWLLLQEGEAPIWPYMQAQAAWAVC